MSAEKNSVGSDVLFFVVSAPSGAGKTSLCRRLMERDPNITFSVSHTTRPPRRGEKEGVDYYFVDDATFDTMIEENRFFEYANVYGRKYGTSRGEIERAKSISKDLLIEIDCQGAAILRKVLPEAIRIFILPPSLESLKERLAARNTDSEKEIGKRVGIAIQELSVLREELSDWPNFQYAVINDNFDKAAQELESIVTAERNKINRHLGFIKALLEK